MSNKVYEIVTDRIISQLEAGTIPWRKPWGSAAGSSGLAKSLVSGNEYRGVNAVMTNCQGYTSPYWITFKQAAAMGGSVRKGEKGTPIVYLGKAEKQSEATGEKSEYSFLRYYTVFNVEQCEGLTIPEAPKAPETPAIAPIDACEAIVSNSQMKAPIRHAGAQAFYSPMLDSITMPVRELFHSSEEYYSTLFHEMAHATGHSQRLDRKLDTAPAAFGTEDYSKEELVAEMASAFLCATAGIEAPVIENQAAYIQGWLKRLRGDSKLLVSAAAQGQKAADYILNK